MVKKGGAGGGQYDNYQIAAGGASMLSGNKQVLSH